MILFLPAVTQLNCVAEFAVLYLHYSIVQYCFIKFKNLVLAISILILNNTTIPLVVISLLKFWPKLKNKIKHIDKTSKRLQITEHVRKLYLRLLTSITMF